MGKVINYVLIASFVLVLSGCKFAPVKKKDGEDPGQKGEQTEQGKDSAYGLQQGGELSIQALDDPNSPLSNRVVYFELDSSTISAADRETLNTHAEFLIAQPEISVVLEGHTDERGTREYNLALGERRAKAVQQLLLLQGVKQEQIQVISFGEERPVALDHNEAAWRLNRRVELLYSGY